MKKDMPMSRMKTIYNDDATELYDVEPGRAKASLIELIDRALDNVPIDIWTIECALPDICEYQSAVGEVRGARFAELQASDRRIRGMRALAAEGTDHLSVYIERLRSRGVKCLAEIRMSDTHHAVNAADPGCPLFTLEHPEWTIQRDDGVAESAMDYSYKEVREHRLAIIVELANAYDIDGLELNFNRWGKQFARNEGRAKKDIMTAYVGEVVAILKQAAAKKGRDKLMLGAWVPSTLAECLDTGCDVEAWAKNGWLDFLVAAEYNDPWPGTRLEEFAPLKAYCPVYAQMSDTLGYRDIRLDNDTARAIAKNYREWGADGIAFWNISCTTGTRGKHVGPEHRKRMFDWMNVAIDPASTGPRRYRYVPLYKGLDKKAAAYRVKENLRSPIGGYRSTIVTFTPETVGKRQVFPFRMADGRRGEKLSGELRFAVLGAGGASPIVADINGTVVRAESVVESNGDVLSRLRLEACPPFRGDNELGLTWNGPLKAETPSVEEMEVLVL